MFDSIVRYVPQKDGLNAPQRGHSGLTKEKDVRGAGGRASDGGSDRVSVETARAEMDAYLAQMALQSARSIRRWTVVKRVALYTTLVIAIAFYAAISTLYFLIQDV